MEIWLLNFKKVAIALIMAGNSSVFAGSMGAVSEAPSKFYIGVEGGDSVSSETHFQPDLSTSNHRFFLPLLTQIGPVTLVHLG